MSIIRSSRDYAVWLDLLIPALREDPEQAERAARFFHSLLVDIEENPQGSVRAIECLETALMVASHSLQCIGRVIFCFQASLGEDFPSGLDSMERVAEAMRRVKAELKRAGSRPRTRRGHAAQRASSCQ